MGVQGTLLRCAATRYVLMPHIAALIFDLCWTPACSSRMRFSQNVQRRPIIFCPPFSLLLLDLDLSFCLAQLQPVFLSILGRITR